MTTAPRPVQVCLSCHAAVSPAWFFCAACGASLRAHGGGFAGAATRDGERRFVAVAVADIAGFTRLSERLEPERMTALLNEVFSRLEEVVLRYEGSVDQFFGDSMMAVFGARVAHEDDAERALLAAFEFDRAVATVHERLKLSVAVRVSVGLDAGHVVVGTIGGKTFRQPTVIGDPVNAARRLQSMAEPGRVLATQRVARLLEDRYRFKPFGELRLRGSGEPLHVFDAVGRESETSGEAVTRRGLTALVGREAILERLKELAAAAGRGEPSVVGLIGRAGTGKKRLLDEAAKLAGEVGVRVVRVTPQRYATHDDEGEGQTVETQRDFSLLHDLAVAVDGEGHHAVTGLVANRHGGPVDEARRHAIGYAFRELVLGAAAREPLLIAVSDLQWADRLSVEALFRAVRKNPADDDGGAGEVRSLRLPALLYTARPGGVVTPRDPVTTIAVGDLDREATVTLAGALCRPNRLDGTLASFLYERSGGNPFYLHELLRHLWSTGAIAAREGTVHLTRAPERIEVPDSLAAAVAARIDTLPAPVREVLRVAAVAGRRFCEPLVCELAAGGVSGVADPARVERAREALALLAARGFIAPDVVRGDGAQEWLFVHDLTRRVAYEGLLTGRRRDLHLAFARRLEERGDEPPESLAHHTREGGDLEKWVTYTLATAEEKKRNQQHEEAQRGFGEIVDALAESMGRVDETKAQTFSMQALTGRGEVNLARGRYDDARADFTMALELARRLGLAAAEARVECGCTRLYDLTAELEMARIHGAEALRLAREAGDREMEALALHRLAAAHLRGGDPREALALLRDALTLRRHRGDAFGTSATLNSMANALMRVGDVAGARAAYEEALALCRANGDRNGLAACLNNLAYLHNAAKHPEEAAPLLREAIAIREQHDDARGVVSSLVNLGQSELSLGDAVAARARLERARDEARRIGYTLGEIEARYLLSDTLRRLDEAGLAVREAEAGLKLALQAGMQEEIGRGRITLGAALVAAGEGEKARVAYAEARDLATQHGLTRLADEAGEALAGLNR